MALNNEIQQSISEEFLKVATLAKPLLPKTIDGKKAILEMKNGGSRNWRQMEWIGWWFEYFVETEIKPMLDNEVGPKYGNTTFDLRMKYIWDLKAHPNNKKDLILNDQEAVMGCVQENGGIGFIIVEGDVEYDDDKESFKNWHDKIKGGESEYVKARIARNAPSRRRKISFSPTDIQGIWIDSLETLVQGQISGWIKGFQKNMRNADGKPRRPKFKFIPEMVPHKNIVGKINLQQKLIN